MRGWVFLTILGDTPKVLRGEEGETNSGLARSVPWHDRQPCPATTGGVVLWDRAGCRLARGGVTLLAQTVSPLT